MLNITFKQIRLFEAVVRHKSFTKAAKELNISQPAVSSQLKKLAQSIGDPLIETVGRKMYLTPVGEKTYQNLQTLLDDFDRFSAEIKTSQSDGIQGELSIAGTTASKYFLPFILSAFLEEHPNITPKLTMLSKAEALKSLQNQSHDIVISSRSFEEVGIHFTPFMTNKLVFVSAPNERLNTPNKISLNNLLQQKLILPSANSSIRQAVDSAFQAEGLTAKPFIELESYELIKQSVMAGLGIGILSTDAFRLEEHTGHLMRLNVVDFPIHKHWYYACPSPHTRSEATHAFIEFLQRYPIETYLKKIYLPALTA